MTIEAEQLVAEAARLQLTWHYAHLLSAKEHRQDVLIKRTGYESDEDSVAATTELAELERYIVQVRAEADRTGVIASELNRVLGALERERALLATMVAIELRAPSKAGRYASHEHSQWGIPGQAIR